MPSILRSPLILSLLAVACGLSGAHAVRPAGSSLEEEGASAPGSQAPSAKSTETAEGSAASGAVLDLREFRPLLAEAGLSQAKELVDDERYGEAAKLVSSWLEKVKLVPTERARGSYALGVLLELSGDLKAAKRAFSDSAKVEWTLREDAWIHLASLDKLEDPEASLANLSRLTVLAREPEALTLEAEALSRLKKYKEAAEVYRRLTASGGQERARFALAENLLALADAAGESEAQKKLATEAAHEAELSVIGLGSEDALVLAVDEFVERAKKSGAVVPAERSIALQLAHLRGLVEASNWEDAGVAAGKLNLPSRPVFSAERCEADFLIGRILAGERKWGEAAERVEGSATHCTTDKALHAWLLFNAGKYAAADGRQTKAIAFYADLERLYPTNSLADDARLRAANSYERIGAGAKFTELLSNIADDYPDGDTTMEGVLTLAMNRIERADWSGAAQVLERAARVIRSKDSTRGHEHAGTERYFLARARHELGEEEEALLEYESIVKEVPLSYYMLHAYSRLLEADPKRAQAALSAGLKSSSEAPFEFPHRGEFETPEFLRGMELLRVGEHVRGGEVLSELGLGEGADDSVLWGMALLYDRAGEAHTSHGIARGRLSDWLAHYPEGDWQEPWEIGFPRPYLSSVEKESLATGVPEWLIYGVMREESTFRPHVVSHANAYGLMQVIEPTARGIGQKAGLPYTPAALKRPQVNIAIGSRVLKELGQRFKKNPWLAIPGYNAGPGRPAQWLRERPNVDFDVWVEMIPYRETRRYTKRVLASRAAYAFVYHRQEAATALVLPKRLTSR